MRHGDLTYAQLLAQGWEVELHPVEPPRNIHQVTLTLRDTSRNAIHTVEGFGSTADDAIAEAVIMANIWLSRATQDPS